MASPSATKNRLVKCPQCGCDAVENGFATAVVKTQTWMRIGGGLRIVARTERVSETAWCNCGAKLPVKAAELLRIAR